jgi:hypothetical protein
MATSTISLNSPVDDHQQVVDGLRGLADLVRVAAWPPWLEPSFDGVMWRFRRALQECMESAAGAALWGAGDAIGVDAGRLHAQAADDARVRCWVADLMACTGGDNLSLRQVTAVTALLRVHLFADELAYLGLLATVITDRAWHQLDGVLADGG